MITLRLVSILLTCFSLSAFAQLPELKDLDLGGWNCGLEGAAKTQDGKERNQQKNRSPVDLTGKTISSFDMTAFLARAAQFDRQIEKRHRREMNSEQKTKVAELEKQIVSVTGWLVLAYQGVPETTNCKSADFLDWHLELSPAPADHPARVGDPTPIICEITPRTQSSVFRSGVRIQKLAAFFRLPDLSFTPTGAKPHKIRVTGFLMWDDEHNKTDTDVGSIIEWFDVLAGKEGYHHPWRSTGWEIHPVLKIEDLGTE